MENANLYETYVQCTINNKINSTPKGVYLQNFEATLDLAVANLLAYKNL